MSGLKPERIEAVLTEAAGEGDSRGQFQGDVACYHRYILALESLGLLEARMGEREREEDVDSPVITGITPLGYDYLMELRQSMMVLSR
jgi:hypothetical protein